MDNLISPFTILIDQREKQPILFQNVWLTKYKANGTCEHTYVNIPTYQLHLTTGDYSILGFENEICFERKSIPDLQRSICHQKDRRPNKHNRDRFERELERMQEMRWSAVIVEGNWLDFLQYCRTQTEMSPAGANGTIIAYQHRFPKTHWLWIPRAAQAKLMYLHFDRFWKDKDNDE